jgi:hypothetical protein
MGTAKVVPAGPGVQLPAGQGHGYWRTYGVTNGLAGLDVRTIYSDREGNLWFGTRGGVSRYDGNTFTTFTSENGLVDEAVWSVCQDKEGISGLAQSRDWSGMMARSLPFSRCQTNKCTIRQCQS